MELSVTPKDSRYIPFTQQPYCCVPTCIQMVMYRHGIPLIPAEEIGYHLGLVVSPDRASLFYQPRVSETPPPAGYGTQIDKPEFEPNAAAKKLGIPLHCTVKSIMDISSPEELTKLLQEVEQKQTDALLCFNSTVLNGTEFKGNGHVCVFDRVIEDGGVRFVDPGPNQPKWRTVEAVKLYEAVQKHPTPTSAGIWYLEVTR